MFTPSSAHKYEKKQISLCQRQDSECTLLKCYLGFGNCGLGGLFGQKERRRGREDESMRRREDAYTWGALPLLNTSQRHYLWIVLWNSCRLSSCEDVSTAKMVQFSGTAASHSLQHWAYMTAATVAHSLTGHTDQANLTTAKEWKVFYSVIVQITAISQTALLAATGNLN